MWLKLCGVCLLLSICCNCLWLCIFSWVVNLFCMMLSGLCLCCCWLLKYCVMGYVSSCFLCSCCWLNWLSLLCLVNLNVFGGIWYVYCCVVGLVLCWLMCRLNCLILSCLCWILLVVMCWLNVCCCF